MFMYHKDSLECFQSHVLLTCIYVQEPTHQAPLSGEGGSSDDDDIDPMAYYENRLKMIDEMRDQGLNPFPHKWPVNMSIPDFIKKYEGISDGTKVDDDEVVLAGES
jgi:hypothetical protein